MHCILLIKLYTFLFQRTPVTSSLVVNIIIEKRALLSLKNISIHVVQICASGPKRVPVTQSSLKPVPIPRARVLGTTRGPQRVQRPASPQKPAGPSVPVKTRCPGDQNINPDQLKTQTQHKSIQSQPKPNSTNSVPAAEPGKQEKPQRKNRSVSCSLTVLDCDKELKILLFPFFTETPTNGLSCSSK